jgi:hypothetical protein
MKKAVVAAGKAFTFDQALEHLQAKRNRLATREMRPKKDLVSVS